MLKRPAYLYALAFDLHVLLGTDSELIEGSLRLVKSMSMLFSRPLLPYLLAHL